MWWKQKHPEIIVRGFELNFIKMIKYLMTSECDITAFCLYSSWLWHHSSLRHPGGAAEADPDDIAEPSRAEPDSLRASLPSASCIGPQTTAAPPGVQHLLHRETSRRRRPQTNQPFEKCLFFFSVPAASQVVSVETGPASGSHDLDVKKQKALAELWPGRRRSEECVCSCKYPAALLTETPRPKGPLHLLVLFHSSWISRSLFSFFYYIYSDVRGEHRTFRTRRRVGSEQIFSQILF